MRDAAAAMACADHRPEFLTGSGAGQQQWMARACEGPVPVKLPTAQALLAEVAATASRSLVEPGAGLGTRVHLVPFQYRIRVLWVVPVAERPTAQALLAEVATTPVRELAVVAPPWLGLGTCAHVAPFQRKVRVRSTVPLSVKPTAQAFEVDVAPTAARSLVGPGLGLGTCVQVVPFQCRIRVWSSRPVKPTAQASLAEVAATPVRALSCAGLGLGTCVQTVPSQCRIRVWFPAPLE